jgi:hypothetical protein
MNNLNKILTWSSISVLLVSIERYSFTDKILLQPYNFLRLHEIVQMVILILITILLPLLLLREVTHNMTTLNIKRGFTLFLIFAIGIYFYATGNGLHEVSSFNLNQYCSARALKGNLCNGFFINDYYTGNILYFAGGAMMVLSLVALEMMKPGKEFTPHDMKILIINAVIYALAIFAYAGFDRVLVGLIYSLAVTAVSGYMFWKVRGQSSRYPLTTYTALTYTLGTIGALLVRIVR